MATVSDFPAHLKQFAEAVAGEQEHREESGKKGLTGLFTNIFGSGTKIYYDKQGTKIEVKGAISKLTSPFKFWYLTRRQFIRKGIDKLLDESQQWHDVAIARITKAVQSDDPKTLEELKNAFEKQVESLDGIAMMVPKIFKKRSQTKVAFQTQTIGNTFHEVITICEQMSQWQKIKENLPSPSAIDEGIAFIAKADFLKIPEELREIIRNSSPLFKFVDAANQKLRQIEADCEKMAKGDLDVTGGIIKAFNWLREKMPSELSEKYALSIQGKERSYREAKNSCLQHYLERLKAMNIERGEEEAKQIGKALNTLQKLPDSDLKPNTDFKPLEQELEKKRKALQQKMLVVEQQLEEQSPKLAEQQKAVSGPQEQTAQGFEALRTAIRGTIPEFPLPSKSKADFDKALKAYNILMGVQFEGKEMQEAVHELNQLDIFKKRVVLPVHEKLLAPTDTYEATKPQVIAELTAPKIFELLVSDEVIGKLASGIDELKQDLRGDAQELTRLKRDARLELKELEERVERKAKELSEIDLDSLGKDFVAGVDSAISDQLSRIIWSTLSVSDFQQLKQKYGLRATEGLQRFERNIERKSKLPGEISQLQECIRQVKNTGKGSISRFLGVTREKFSDLEWEELQTERQNSTSWSDAIKQLETRFGAMLRNPEKKRESEKISLWLVKLGDLTKAKNAPQVNATFDSVEFLLRELGYRPNVQAQIETLEQRTEKNEKSLKQYQALKQALETVKSLSESRSAYQKQALGLKGEEEINRRLVEEKARLKAIAEALGF